MTDAKTAVNAAPMGERNIYKVMIDAPIERVWAELVDVESPRPFFFGAQCETSTGDMREGAEYRMVTPDGKFVSVVGKITAFEPPHKFVQIFKFTTMDEAPATVSYQLEETPNGVLQSDYGKCAGGFENGEIHGSGRRLHYEEPESLVRKRQAYLWRRFDARHVQADGADEPKAMAEANWPLRR